MSKLLGFLKKYLSRKFIIVILSVVVVPQLTAWGVPPEVQKWIITLALTYLGVEGIADIVERARKNGNT